MAVPTYDSVNMSSPVYIYDDRFRIGYDGGVPIEWNAVDTGTGSWAAVTTSTGSWAEVTTSTGAWSDVTRLT